MSPCVVNNVFIPKKDSAIRATTDYRALNRVTKTDAFPMEDVQMTLNRLARKKVCSTFYLNNGFHQVKLAGASKPLAAVKRVPGLPQYTRVPQGLKTSRKFSKES